jgi:hypothetical protein
MCDSSIGADAATVHDRDHDCRLFSDSVEDAKGEASSIALRANLLTSGYANGVSLMRPAVAKNSSRNEAPRPGR